MKQPTGQKRGVWFWVGVVLLSISALLWLLFILSLIAEPENVGYTLLGAVLVTIIPIGIGIYAV